MERRGKGRGGKEGKGGEVGKGWKRGGEGRRDEGEGGRGKEMGSSHAFCFSNLGSFVDEITD